jgi:hypothetical protein
MMKGLKGKITVGRHLLVLEVEEHIVLQDEPSRLPVLDDVPCKSKGEIM